MMSRRLAATSEFKVFKEAATKGGIVKALIVKGGAAYRREAASTRWAKRPRVLVRRDLPG